MNDKIWQRIGDYCSGLLDKSEERELRAWMDEAEENKQLFMEGVKWCVSIKWLLVRVGMPRIH